MSTTMQSRTSCAFLAGPKLRTTVLAAAVCLPCASSCTSNDEPARPRDSDPVNAEPPTPPVLDPNDYAQLHRCGSAEPADPRDALLSGEPDALSYGDGVDLVLPEQVLAWMRERRWQPSHDGWHNIRRCMNPMFTMPPPAEAPPLPFDITQPGAMARVCANTELVPAQGECENARDGYEFLVMHRHMIRSLKQAFPRHARLFDGFPHFPFSIEDVPEQWRDRWTMGGLFRSQMGEVGWDPHILEVARRLEAIGGTNDGGFADEGALGMFIQCGVTGPDPMAGGQFSIHGALHFKWVVQDSPHSLGKQTANLENFMFWKLHGWIDDVWQRYREVKGLATDPSDPLEAEITSQCWEMHELGHVVDSACTEQEVTLPAESGVFHETVRPILEQHCKGCHSECSPSGNLSLGGRISSAEIVENLVGRTSFSGGQFKRVVPGKPRESWLYLKLAGLAGTAGCEGRCLTQTMPPFGMTVTLSEAELAAVARWIEDGALPPGS